MASRLVGSWRWNADVATLRTDGTGTYLRRGATCNNFTYTVEGGVYTEHADRVHACGKDLTLSFRFVIEGSTLVLTHIGSGFVSDWTRISDPPPAAVPAPDPVAAPPPPAKVGCSNDMDCKGDRVCVDGRCKDP